MVRTCCSTFMASWGVIAPLVMSSSRESVNAMPILQRFKWSITAQRCFWVTAMWKGRKAHDDPR